MSTRNRPTHGTLTHVNLFYEHQTFSAKELAEHNVLA